MKSSIPILFGSDFDDDQHNLGVDQARKNINSSTTGISSNSQRNNYCFDEGQRNIGNKSNVIDGNLNNSQWGGINIKPRINNNLDGTHSSHLKISNESTATVGNPFSKPVQENDSNNSINLILTPTDCNLIPTNENTQSFETENKALSNGDTKNQSFLQRISNSFLAFVSSPDNYPLMGSILIAILSVEIFFFSYAYINALHIESWLDFSSNLTTFQEAFHLVVASCQQLFNQFMNQSQEHLIIEIFGGLSLSFIIDSNPSIWNSLLSSRKETTPIPPNPLSEPKSCPVLPTNRFKILLCIEVMIVYIVFRKALILLIPFIINWINSALSWIIRISLILILTPTSLYAVKLYYDHNKKRTKVVHQLANVTKKLLRILHHGGPYKIKYLYEELLDGYDIEKQVIVVNHVDLMDKQVKLRADVDEKTKKQSWIGYINSYFFSDFNSRKPLESTIITNEKKISDENVIVVSMQGYSLQKLWILVQKEVENDSRIHKITYQGDLAWADLSMNSSSSTNKTSVTARVL